MIVIDASTVLELLLRTAAAPQIEARIFLPEETLHAPHIIDLEVVQVLRRYWASGEMDSTRGVEAIADLADLPLIRYPHDIFLARLWELRHNMTAYDAAYVALAESLPAPLLTCDTRLASASGHGATIELLRSP